MLRVFTAFTFCALLVGAQPVSAGFFCHTLTGRIYDLSASHPNMEPFANGLEPGIVLPTLGDDGRPEFNPATTALSVTNATDFWDWYHDTPANLSDGFLIDLLRTSPGVYSFSSSDFFPIDDQLLGNEGNPHNYHFTVAASMMFEHAPGQYFSVSADDDAWVFVDGELALDLGGVHPATGGSIDFDTLGLTPGQSYQLAIFFAERHTTGSELHIETNLGCVPEPSTAALTACGVFSAACLWRRKRLR